MTGCRGQSDEVFHSYFRKANHEAKLTTRLDL